MEAIARASCVVNDVREPVQGFFGDDVELGVELDVRDDGRAVLAFFARHVLVERICCGFDALDLAGAVHRVDDLVLVGGDGGAVFTDENHLATRATELREARREGVEAFLRFGSGDAEGVVKAFPEGERAGGGEEDDREPRAENFPGRACGAEAEAVQGR